MKEERGSFSGGIGFVLAAAGSAVGLGNLWRFPYLAAQHGGGIFIFVYLILAVTFGFSLLTLEISMGRKAKSSALRAYPMFHKKFGFVGYLATLIPTIILEVKPILWMSLFLIFTILPTVAFYLRRLFKKYQVMMGIPFFYLAIICILDSCTIKDLYGITSHGELDKSPAWVDALLVTFIIVFFQYIGLTVINLVRRPKKRTRK